jgi:hypothetical protein
MTEENKYVLELNRTLPDAPPVHLWVSCGQRLAGLVGEKESAYTISLEKA